MWEYSYALDFVDSLARLIGRRMCLPEFYEVHASGCGDHPAVGADRQAPKPCAMPCQGQQFLSGLRVPDFYCAIQAGRKDALPVGVERECQHSTQHSTQHSRQHSRHRPFLWRVGILDKTLETGRSRYRWQAGISMKASLPKRLAIACLAVERQPKREGTLRDAQGSARSAWQSRPLRFELTPCIALAIKGRWLRR